MSESEKFEYNAPTYVDFRDGMDESKDVDDFFDLAENQEEQEIQNTNKSLNVVKEEVLFTPGKQSTPNAPDTPDHACMNEENFTPNIRASCITPKPQNGRRSRMLFEALDALSLSCKTHKMVTRKDPRTPLLELRGRSVPRNVNFIFEHNNGPNKRREILFEDEENLSKQIENMSLNSVDKEKLNSKENGQISEELCSDREDLGVRPLNETVTISNSETVSSELQNQIDVQKSLNDTNSKSTQRVIPQVSFKLTIPKTPYLQTKTRARPNHVLSHSQEEERILKEIRSHQYKANPVPKGLFKAPAIPTKTLKNNVTSKHTLSKSNSTQQDCLKKNQLFNSKKSIHHTTNDKCVNVIETDKTGLVVTNKEVAHRGVITISKPKVSKPQPFSFYERDVERFRQKQEKIRHIIEEERKRHEFYANPLPRYVRHARRHFTFSQESLGSTGSHSTTCFSQSNGESFVFRAQPSHVLHQKPFIPRKSIKPCTRIDNFKLYTEERSEQRERYERMKRQRELELQLQRQERENERRELEERIYREARKSTVHKPLPIPRNKPFVSQHVEAQYSYPQNYNH